MAKLGFKPRPPAPSWSLAAAPPCFLEPLCSFLGFRSRDSQLCENPSFAVLAPPGAGSQQRQACGFPERALGVGGRRLSHRMRSLLTSGWGRLPKFGNFHSEPLVGFCVCVRKTNLSFGTLHLACRLQAWGSCGAMISPWAVPSLPGSQESGSVLRKSLDQEPEAAVR